jgi:hypothetical protein
MLDMHERPEGKRERNFPVIIADQPAFLKPKTPARSRTLDTLVADKLHFPATFTLRKSVALMTKLRLWASWLADPLHLSLCFASLLPVMLVLVYVISYRLTTPFGDEWNLNGGVAVAAVIAGSDGIGVACTHRLTSTCMSTWEPGHYDLDRRSVIGPATLIRWRA